MIIEVVKTIFQSRKRHTPEGIERGEYQSGFSFAGIVDVCIIRRSPAEYRHFSCYLYWNDEELDCCENEVLSERNGDRCQALWDALLSRMVDLSTFDDWRNDSITRFQVITKNGTPRLFLSVDVDRTREYPTISTFTDYLPHLPLVRQSELVPPNHSASLAKSPPT